MLIKTGEAVSALVLDNDGAGGDCEVKSVQAGVLGCVDGVPRVTIRIEGHGGIVIPVADAVLLAAGLVEACEIAKSRAH